MQLKKIRIDMGLNQKQMAKEFSVSFSAYCRYENGQLPIPSKMLIDIEKLGYSIDWLLTGGGDMHKATIDPSVVAREPQTQYIIEEYPRVRDIVALLRDHPDYADHIYFYLQGLISKPK